MRAKFLLCFISLLQFQHSFANKYVINRGDCPEFYRFTTPTILGATITLVCDPCFVTKPVALWRRATGKSIKHITSWRSIKFDFSGKSNYVLRHNMALTIMKVTKADAGIYACSRENKPKSLHHVIIRNANTRIYLSKSEKGMEKQIEPKSKPSQFSYRWEEWSTCSGCLEHEEGTKRRRGYAFEMVETAEIYHNGVPYQAHIGLYTDGFWEHLKNIEFRDSLGIVKCKISCREKRERGFANLIQSYKPPDCVFTKPMSVDFVREGDTIKLRCDWCVKRYGGVEWYLHDTTSTRPSAPREVSFDWYDNEDENRVVLNYDMSLEIRRARPSDAGTYVCRESNYNTIKNLNLIPTALSFHLLFTKNSKHPLHVVDTTKKQKPYLGRPNVYTKWNNWGPCSSCDTPGKRARIGTCFIKNKNNKQGFVDFPCFRSNKLLKFWGWKGMSSSDMRRRGEKYSDEKMIEACNVPCPGLVEYDPFSAVAKQYKAVGKNQVMKKIEVQQSTVKSYVRNDVTLPCPDARSSDVVEWKNSSLVAMSSASRDSKLPRVYVDVQTGSLHISNASLIDTQLYYCSVNGVRILATRLVVSKQHVDMQAFKENFLRIGNILLVITVIFVVISTVRVLMKYILDCLVPSRHK